MPKYAAMEDRLTEEEIVAELQGMIDSDKYKTDDMYSVDAPDQKVTFMDKHLAYIKKFPRVRPRHYIANLKLRLRKF